MQFRNSDRNIIHTTSSRDYWMDVDMLGNEEGAREEIATTPEVRSWRKISKTAMNN